MIIFHKAKRLDNKEEVIGFLTKMWGQYHITPENEENTAYPVDENTIEPYINGKKLSEEITLTNEEKIKFLRILVSTMLPKGSIGESLNGGIRYAIEKIAATPATSHDENNLDIFVDDYDFKRGMR